jgi:hypothetical protein
MAYWGIAYTLGPNYNMPAAPERDREAWQAVLRAQAAAAGVSDAERDYIAAIATRYSADAPVDRRALDEAYANAMRQLAQAHPDDLDAATLYAESLMDLRPWNLWTHAGEPQPGTLEIVAVLESVLARNPEHPGANHYYIHAVEASNEPARALPSADRLGGISPGAGHLVHMPSHIYIRTGRYADATDTNVRAVAVDEKYIREQNVQGAYAMMYYPHNVDFIYASAAFDGRSKTAIEAADKVAGTIHFAMIPEMPMLEGFVPRPLFARLRFGKWQEILAQPAPPAELPYATGVWHYARGIAFLRTGKLREAGAELALWDPLDDHTLRFQVNSALARGGAPNLPRRALRVPTHWPVQVRMGARTRPAHVYSVSTRGAFLATAGPALRRSLVHVTLPLHDDAGEPLRVAGEVVATNVPGNLRRRNLPLGMGVRFLGLGPNAERTLQRYADERARDLAV